LPGRPSALASKEDQRFCKNSHARRYRKGRKESSFYEQKEAKKLHSFAPVSGDAQTNEKFFGSFFQKRTASLLTRDPR
jgi:hypothetical protein